MEDLPTRTFFGRDEVEIAIPNLHNTVTNFGIFGKQDKSTASGAWPCNSNNHYLFIGDLWVGAKLPNGEIKVTESVSPESADDPEWIPTSAISIKPRPLSESDEETRTTYRSDETGIGVTHRTFAWRDADFILYSFELYNTGSVGDLDSVFVGLRWDSDVSSAGGKEFHLGDLAGLDIDNSLQQPVMGYVRDEDGDDGISPGWIGNYFLNTAVFTHTFWAVGTDQLFDEDQEQFRSLASGQFLPDAASATDYRLLQAVGPFTLNAGDTLGPIDVALVIGAGLDGLRASRNAALQKYLIVDVETPPVSSIPDAFKLAQNYPNPFNPATTIPYTVPLQQGDAIVKLQVFNLLGQKVRTLVNKKQQAGQYAIQWDGKDDSGVPVSSGVYLYRLSAGNLFEVRKMALIK